MGAISGARRIQAHLRAAWRINEHNEHVFDPAELAGRTRDGYEVAVRKAFTLFISHGQIDRMLPMKVQDLKKMLTELVLAGESVNSPAAQNCGISGGGITTASQQKVSEDVV